MKRRNPSPPPSQGFRASSLIKPALIGGVGLLGLYGAYHLGKSAAAPPAARLRAGASQAFRKRQPAAAAPAEATAGTDDLGIVWYGSENHTLSDATVKIIGDAQAGRYLTGTVNAPDSQYAIKIATANGSALLKCGYWLAVAGSYLHNTAILATAKEYQKRGFAAASALTGDSGSFETVRAIYAAASAVLTPHQADKQIRYILGVLGTPVTSPGSFDTQKAAQQDKNVIENTVRQSGQDVADAANKAATALAWVGGLITGRAPIGANPILFDAWKWGGRAAVLFGGYLVARAYARPYLAAAKATVQRVTGGATDAAEAIQNGSRAVRKMIGQNQSGE